jgi:hypothetical protein
MLKYPRTLFYSNGNVYLTKTLKGLIGAYGSTLEPNGQLHPLIHQVISKNIGFDESFRAMALYQKSGFLNINDSRVFTPFGRVADPEDILGTIALDDGVMIPGTYEPMPTHRLYTSNGLFQLNDFLYSRLLESLENQYIA